MTEPISIVEDGKIVSSIKFKPTVPSRPITKQVHLQSNLGTEYYITKIASEDEKIKILKFPNVILAGKTDPIELQYTPDVNDTNGIKTIIKIMGYWIG